MKLKLLDEVLCQTINYRRRTFSVAGLSTAKCSVQCSPTVEIPGNQWKLSFVLSNNVSDHSRMGELISSECESYY